MLYKGKGESVRSIHDALDGAQNVEFQIAVELYVRGRGIREKEIENMLLSVIGIALGTFIFPPFQ